jgi:hypothetical protein
LNVFPKMYLNDQFQTNLKGSNHLLQARLSYEKCICILLIERILNRQREIQNQKDFHSTPDMSSTLMFRLCDEYRFATQLLYKTGMGGMTRQFHYLILNIFKDSPLALQERLEAYSFLLNDNQKDWMKLLYKYELNGFKKLFRDISKNSIILELKPTIINQKHGDSFLLSTLSESVYKKLDGTRQTESMLDQAIKTLRKESTSWISEFPTKGHQTDLFEKLWGEIDDSEKFYLKKDNCRNNFIEMFSIFSENINRWA